MIQRIQTLFLIIASLAIIMLLFYPVANITEYTTIQSEALETDYYELGAMGFNDPSPDSKPNLNIYSFVPLLVLVIMIIILIVYAISRYKNRLHQLKLVKISIFLNIIMIAGIFLNYPKLFTDQQMSIESGPGAYFPLISLVFLMMSYRYIMKDEKLIKSVDRLR
jgi:uncharacterized membrane protein YhaH (DUF805 family)